MMRQTSRQSGSASKWVISRLMRNIATGNMFNEGFIFRQAVRVVLFGDVIEADT